MIQEGAAQREKDLLLRGEDPLVLREGDVRIARRERKAHVRDGAVLLDLDGRARPLAIEALGARLDVVLPDGQPVHPEGSVRLGDGRAGDGAHEVDPRVGQGVARHVADHPGRRARGGFAREDPDPGRPEEADDQDHKPSQDATEIHRASLSGP
ncbi:hypothetical protein D3C86_1671610 [compost metagenome]